MIIKTWDIEEMCGYKPITTYYEDFSIADKFGTSAIKDTYKRAFEGAKDLGYKYLTELSMALNWKIWYHYELCNMLKADLYDKLWKEILNWIYKNFTKEELSYFYRVTD